MRYKCAFFPLISEEWLVKYSKWCQGGQAESNSDTEEKKKSGEETERRVEKKESEDEKGKKRETANVACK